jgi:enoyl-CoA hydratase
MSSLVNHHCEESVGLVPLNDPGHRNALSRAMSLALADAVDAVLEGGARVIVLSAAAPVFCAGGSLDDMIRGDTPLEDFYLGVTRLACAPVPTIAAVGGPTIGAGVNLPLACDVVIASTSARFDPRFLDVGIHPGGGHLWRLAQRIGPQGAAAMVLCGDALSGPEAAAQGLAWRCVEDDQLESTVMMFAQRVTSRSDELVRRTKATLAASLSITDSYQAVALELAAQQWSMAQPHYAERVRAIAEQIAARRP